LLPGFLQLRRHTIGFLIVTGGDIALEQDRESMKWAFVNQRCLFRLQERKYLPSQNPSSTLIIKLQGNGTRIGVDLRHGS
jgi:hypothetical protein